MANYGMGGADGRGADDMQELVRNQKQNLEHDRRALGIDVEQGRKPQVSRICPVQGLGLSYTQVSRIRPAAAHSRAHAARCTCSWDYQRLMTVDVYIHV